MPPSLHDWLRENHLARFVADLVKSLDLSAFYRSYEEKDGRGQAAYHPMMMVRLLLYGYCIGVTSSRQIEKRTYEDVAFRCLSGGEHPDHSVINEFRKRHLGALAGLFVQALQLCQKAGLVKLGHVAVDGTKRQANASKHKAMSYGRMNEAEEKLKAEVDELLKRAEATDAAKDEKEKQGQTDKLPEELARRESRLKKIQQAKAELEAEAKQKAEQEKAAAGARPMFPFFGASLQSLSTGAHPRMRRANLHGQLGMDNLHKRPSRNIEGRRRLSPRRDWELQGSDCSDIDDVIDGAAAREIVGGLTQTFCRKGKEGDARFGLQKDSRVASGIQRVVASFGSRRVSLRQDLLLVLGRKPPALCFGHHQNDGAEYGVLHTDERPVGNAGGWQACRRASLQATGFGPLD